MLWILLVQWDLFRVNLTVPPGKLNSNILFYATIVLLAVLAVETVRFYLSFRLPKNGGQPTGTTADGDVESKERN
jgi:hypothetical protein